MEWLGCFVTITVQGQLRGCIGQVVPRQPLHRAVPLLAIRAAREDRRFQPIETHELGDLRIEISVLGPLAPLDSRSPEKVLARLQPGELGVFLQCQGRSATYLPQVWRHLPDPVDFMDSLSRKAGLPPLAWRHPDALISVYEVLAFTEEATMKAKSHPTSQAKQTKPAQDK